MALPPSGPAPPGWPRVPPAEPDAESTHAEARYWIRRIEQRTPLLVRFRDGEELRGSLAWHDRGALRLDLAGGVGHRIVMKHAVAWVAEEDAAAARPTHPAEPPLGAPAPASPRARRLR